MILEVDHVVPRAAGGSNDPSNLVTACSDCNGGKSATPPGVLLIADVKQRQLDWTWESGLDDVEAECERDRIANIDRVAAEFEAIWPKRWTSYPDQPVAEWMPESWASPPPRPIDWADQVWNLVGCGVSIEHMSWILQSGWSKGLIGPPSQLWAYVMKWSEREARRLDEESWDAFYRRNPHFADHRKAGRR